MCNTNTQQFIEQVVADKVANNVMFTLFDVTLEVQALEKAAGLPISRHRNIHDDVAGSANSEALSNGWNRTTRPMGGNLVALVYFNPVIHDVTTYTPLPRKDAPAPKNANPALDGVNPAALAFAGSATSPNSAGVTSSPSVITPPMIPVSPDHKAVDRWNRLRLTCEVMRAGGFNPGDMVYAYADNGKLVLTNNLPTSTQPIAKYIVDCHCNVRVTPKTLKAAGLTAGAFKMTATTDCVAVEP
ncbi:MAG: hypothetical protein M0R80_07780 [Proteobacteria bacterium]|nr:hypothetical protein [Pseudomonadota bacterium]